MGRQAARFERQSEMFSQHRSRVELRECFMSNDKRKRFEVENEICRKLKHKRLMLILFQCGMVRGEVSTGLVYVEVDQTLKVKLERSL